MTRGRTRWRKRWRGGREKEGEGGFPQDQHLIDYLISDPNLQMAKTLQPASLSSSPQPPRYVGTWLASWTVPLRRTVSCQGCRSGVPDPSQVAARFSKLWAVVQGKLRIWTYFCCSFLRSPNGCFPLPLFLGIMDRKGQSKNNCFLPGSTDTGEVSKLTGWLVFCWS